MAGEMAVFGLKYRYARIAGAIETINAENLKVKEEIAFLRARLDQNTAALASLHIDLKTVEAASALAFQVDLRGTAPRKTWPKNHQGSWGSLTRQVLTQLRVAEGCPMTINDVALEVAEAMGVAGNEQEMAKELLINNCN